MELREGCEGSEGRILILVPVSRKGTRWLGKGSKGEYSLGKLGEENVDKELEVVRDGRVK